MRPCPSLFLVSVLSVLLGVWLGRQAPVANQVEPFTALTGEAEAAAEEGAEVVQFTLNETLKMADSFERDLAIRKIIAAMPVEEFGATFQSLSNGFLSSGDFIKDQRRTSFHLEVQRMLLQRWATLEANSALTMIEQLLTTLDDNRDAESYLYDHDHVDTDEMMLIAAFFDEWFRAEPARVLATIENWKDRPNQQGAGFIEYLRWQLLRENPASAVMLFEQDKNAEAPFNLGLYYHVLQVKLEESPLVALRFIAENADYVPSTSWLIRTGGWHRQTLFDLALEQDFQGTYALWKATESDEFKAEFARYAIDYTLLGDDLEMASQFFYAMNSVEWTAGPVDPFAAPRAFQADMLDIARSYFSGLAQHDVDLALAEARNLEHFENQDYIYGVIAVQLAQSDPQRALALCRELPPKVSTQFIGEVFQARMHQDFEAAKAELALLEPETWPSSQQATILGIMWEKEPIYAAEFLVQMNVPPALVYDIKRSLTDLVNNGQFETYMAVVDRLPPLDFGYETNRFMGNIAEGWNAVDPEGARHYGVNLSPGKSRIEFLKALAVHTANTDYQQAWDLSETTEDPYLKKQLRTAAILELAETNPEGALTFASEQDDCAEAMSDVLHNWTSEDAYAALSYIRAMPPSDQSVEALSAYIAQTASSSSLPDVQQMLQTLPAGRAQDNAIESVARQWSQSNPMVLAEWINEMPPSDGRDGAVCALADSLESYDYSQAFAWSSTIADEQRRKWRLRNSLEAYAELEPEAARRLLDEADLSNREKTALYLEVFDE